MPSIIQPLFNFRFSQRLHVKGERNMKLTWCAPKRNYQDHCGFVALWNARKAKFDISEIHNQ